MTRLLCLLAVLTACPTPASPGGDRASTPAEAKSESESWRSLPVTKTRHGTCRMACRQIDDGEVARVLREGRWVRERTREEPGRCPSHALEGPGDAGERLRIVVAACETELRLVTAIDLDREWPCSCE